MNQKLRGGLTAALLITTLGTAPAGYAGQIQTGDPGSEAASSPEEASSAEPTATNLSATLTNPQPEAADALEKPSSTLENASSPDSVKMGEHSPVVDKSATLSPAPATTAAVEPVKVGESQTQATSKGDEQQVIAKLHSHELAGRKAVTLYVRNIPVLTFLSTRRSTSDDSKQGQVDSSAGASPEQGQAKSLASQSTEPPIAPSAGAADAAEDPAIWRAAEIAAKLNQLNLDAVDANAITVNWQAGSGNKPDRYIIKMNGAELVEVDADTILPDSTNDRERDALQITNRLRRLISNAQPLQDIPGKPKQPRFPSLTLGAVRMRLSGLASWYGPGFHGAQSASGEVFNQHALTAAHRSLPFGTRVRVVNLYNGKSVVVRINDRGPFSPGRVIDLSAGAASVLGLIQSGVAPVRLEVLGAQRAVAVGN